MDEVADFWDSHSLADYWDQTKEVNFEINVRRRKRVVIEPDVYAKVENQARKRGILPETLINMWLVEKLHGAA